MIDVAAIQFRCGPEATIEANLERAMDVVREDAADADLVCLPEYFSTPYFPAEQDPAAFELANPDDGEFVDAIRTTARETNTAIVAPFFEEGLPGGRYYNAAVVVDGSGVVGKYRKLHPFQRPGYHETFYFAPGDLGAPVIEAGGLSFGIMLCYDRHFPELARAYALKGADAVFVPTCSFGDENRDAVWAKELTGLAVANSLYVVGVNRAGSERGKTHFGGTTVIDPTGDQGASLGAEPGVLRETIDPTVVADVRNRTKHLNDIRAELLPDLDRL